MNAKVRDILYNDLPCSMRRNIDFTDALHSSVNLDIPPRYILEYAVLDGWLKHDGNTSSTVGTRIEI